MRAPTVLIITDRFVVPGGNLAAAVGSALAILPPGSTWVRLREPELCARELLAYARDLVAICHERGARLLLDDRLDVAAAAMADGVHCSGRGPRPGEIRALWPGAVVGLGCHSVGEVAVAAAAGVDYAQLGLVNPPSAEGLERLVRARQVVPASFPILVSGRVEPTLVAPLLLAGASGVAVCRTLLADLAPDVAAHALGSALALPVDNLRHLDSPLTLAHNLNP